MNSFMKAFILVLVFSFCKTDENTTEVECMCGLVLNNGQTLEKTKLSNETIEVSDNCNRNDFDICVNACNQTFSNQTNGFDLNKPIVGDKSDITLGQMYCNKIGFDVKEANILLMVTLDCQFNTQLTQVLNGTVVNVGSSVSESSVTRVLSSEFTQSLQCVNKMFTTSTE